MKTKINPFFKTVKCCAQIIRLQWRQGKTLFLMHFFLGIFQESKSIFAMVLPALVIQFIQDNSRMDKILVAIGLVSLAMTAMSFGSEYLRRTLSDYSLRVTNYMIAGLDRHAMEVDLQTFESKEGMEQFDIAYDGLWNSQDASYMIFMVIISKLFSFGVTAYIFASIHWSIAVLVAASLVLEFRLNMRQSERIHEKDKEQSPYRYKENYVVNTILDCRVNKDIFLYRADDFFRNRYEKLAREEFDIDVEKNHIHYRYDTKYNVISLFRTGAIYMAAVLQYMRGILPIANFTMFATAAKQMTYSIWQIIQGFSYLYRSAGYFEDYLQYMDIRTQDEKEEGSKPCKPAEEEITRIEFRHVFFRYQNQKEYAIRDMSFTVEEGQTVAIVGDNGAGKSTVMKLLLRLYPVTQGDILVNGRSIYSYDRGEYLSHFATAFQDFMLYSVSIRENIRFDRAGWDARIPKLLEDIGLSHKIAALPEGLDTPYTKRFYQKGVEFSGGEEQKLVIARAMVRESAVLLLDEPTAALDPLAEYSIYELLHKLRGDRMAFFVSHRMSTTRECDKILVIDQGRLAEEGSHEELLERHGLYDTMFSMQKQYYEWDGKEHA